MTRAKRAPSGGMSLSGESTSLSVARRPLGYGTPALVRLASDKHTGGAVERSAVTIVPARHTQGPGRGPMTCVAQGLCCVATPLTASECLSNVAGGETVAVRQWTGVAGAGGSRASSASALASAVFAARRHAQPTQTRTNEGRRQNTSS